MRGTVRKLLSVKRLRPRGTSICEPRRCRYQIATYIIYLYHMWRAVPDTVNFIYYYNFQTTVSVTANSMRALDRGLRGKVRLCRDNMHTRAYTGPFLGRNSRNKCFDRPGGCFDPRTVHRRSMLRIRRVSARAVSTTGAALLGTAAPGKGPEYQQLLAAV